MIRRMESIGWGSSRDHFFHSFQNYFFGLYALLTLPDHFTLYRDVAQLGFNLDPFDVWLMAALWHDVGYGIENFRNVAVEIFGRESDELVARQMRVNFMQLDTVQSGLTDISCLMSRLLAPARARTNWLAPRPGDRPSRRERQLREALIQSFLDGNHGIASSLRLYVETIPYIKKKQTENRLPLEQTVLLTCASMPFHDWKFRKCLRQVYGECVIPTTSLPFAALLTFVDSIQDDRRDLRGVQAEIHFLERLLIEDPATVTAQVNILGVKETSVLWKVVEARDVAASLSASATDLNFAYPQWMVN